MFGSADAFAAAGRGESLLVIRFSEGKVMTPATQDVVRVYWQPGCTSCLRTKEFLTRYDVAFESRNVLADEAAFGELARFGLRHVPIVTKGERWANGAILKDVAELVGIEGVDMTMLAPQELWRRLILFLDGALRFYGQIPDRSLHDQLPNRPRSYTDLVYHIFSNADAFVEEKEGIPLVVESYRRRPAADANGRSDIAAYAQRVFARLNDWHDRKFKDCDWKSKADVFYGEQNQHQFLERTAWHCAQHVRQLMWVLEGLDVTVRQPISSQEFAGLPMPQKVWDD